MFAEINGAQKIQEPISDDLCMSVAQVLSKSRSFSFARESPLGVIRQTKHQRANGDEFYRYVEFHPMLLAQFEKDGDKESESMKTFDNFDAAVYEFFSNLEGRVVIKGKHVVFFIYFSTFLC